MKSVAEPVGFAVSVRFVMLLSVFAQAMVPLHGLTVYVGVVLILWRPLRFLAAAVFSVQAFDERRVSLVAVLSFGVILWALSDRRLGLPFDSSRALSNGTADRRFGYD
jgi:hypothetical protein